MPPGAKLGSSPPLAACGQQRPGRGLGNVWAQGEVPGDEKGMFAKGERVPQIKPPGRPHVAGRALRWEAHSPAHTRMRTHAHTRVRRLPV